MTRKAATVILLAALFAGEASAQDFLSVPYVVTANPEVFCELFANPRTNLSHALMIGDSQETSPNGQGTAYMPAFNAAWAGRYGTAGMTPLVQPGINFGAGSPPAEWLVRGVIVFPFISTYYNEAQTLPGLGNWELPVPSTPTARGWFAVLQSHATDVVPGVDIDRARTWLNTSQGVYIDVYGLRDPAYGDINVRWSMSPTASPNVSATQIGNGNTNFAGAPGTSAVAKHRFGPVTWPQSGANSIQVEVVGADAGKPARMVSMSFVSVASPVGLTVTDIAQGGYNTTSLVTNQATALDQLGSFNADCAFIALGANDASAFSPTVFKANLASLIGTIRAHTSSTLPIILLADPYRGSLGPAQYAPYETFPRKEAELATELTNVCFVNSRRLTHEAGWTPANASAYLADGVHYKPAAALLKANLEVSTLWSTFVCQADVGIAGGIPGRDAILDNNDFIAFIAAFFSAQPIADMGKAGGLPGSDTLFDNNDFIAFIGAFFNDCP